MMTLEDRLTELEKRLTGIQKELYEHLRENEDIIHSIQIQHVVAAYRSIDNAIRRLQDAIRGDDR